MIHEPSTCKLGKLPPKFDARTFKLARYLAALPPTPPSADWGAKVGPDWVSGTAPAPSGFDLAALQADLAALGTAGKVA